MNTLTLLLTIALFFIAFVVAFLFYREISKANEECQQAKNVIPNIVMTFGEKMRAQENRASLIAERVDGLSSEEERLLAAINEHERQLVKITRGVENRLPSEPTIAEELRAIEEKITQASSRQEVMKDKLQKLEKTRFVAPTRSEPKITTPIPIKRESALAPLTECQVEILKILATEGEKTAPEMKDKIGISREHTARLMRRLYDEAYVERDMRKRPYVYRIKEEARKILRSG